MGNANREMQKLEKILTTVPDQILSVYAENTSKVSILDYDMEGQRWSGIIMGELGLRWPESVSDFKRLGKIPTNAEPEYPFSVHHIELNGPDKIRAEIDRKDVYGSNIFIIDADIYLNYDRAISIIKKLSEPGYAIKSIRYATIEPPRVYTLDELKEEKERQTTR